MILITGLGPGDIARIPGPVLDLLLDDSHKLIIRTRNHPAAEQIAALRSVEFCDDLYESLDTFEDVYSAIADRVIAAGSQGAVIYAVPGGPTVGEFAVRDILHRGDDVQVIPTETFVDAILSSVEYDPFSRGLQILNGHELPRPLMIDKPTIVGHLDRPEILADVAAALSRAIPEGTTVTVFSGLGAIDEKIVVADVDRVDADLAGFRTSIWIDSAPGGIVGAIQTMDRLRRECPWDQEQTHSSLTKYLIEESYELIEAIDDIEEDPTDLVAYARVEEEVGDVLLQVLFHAAIASESGAFDINDAGEVLRQKLVRRHPHVFGNVEVADAAEVKSNWDRIKAEEKGGEKGEDKSSSLDGIPSGMPAMFRASKVQNRAEKAGLHTGAGSLTRAIALLEAIGEAKLDDASPLLGQVLFELVDFSRQAGIDSETALRSAVSRFETEIRSNETVVSSSRANPRDSDEMVSPCG
jgi:tetrapyrrole methylase family protein / MazG family protein